MKLTHPHPFLDQKMFALLERSGVTSVDSGWIPVYFHHQDSFSFAYHKHHSFGEFIFDWAWADLYQRFGQRYYPKLVQALAVTPISAPKFINPNHDIYQLVYDYYQQGDFSSHHVLFSEEQDKKWFLEKNYFYQKTLQFHFINKFDSFESFLAELKMRKRKNVCKERKAVQTYSVTIERKPYKELTFDQKLQVYQLYLSTIHKKYSQAYLTQAFFEQLDAGFLFLAYQAGEIIAMSLFFEDETTLYGRYWGIHPQFEQVYPFLHFELCYYRGIEYTIEKKLKKFEAGAQGEQKLLRGFTPVEIGSLHHVKNPQFHQAIGDFVKRQNEAYTDEIERLKNYLPFKRKE